MKVYLEQDQNGALRRARLWDTNNGHNPITTPRVGESIDMQIEDDRHLETWFRGHVARVLWYKGGPDCATSVYLILEPSTLPQACNDAV